MSSVSGILLNHLYSASQSRELDRIAIDEFGIPAGDLMQAAGRFSYTTLKRRWPEADAITVICGGGNNAGDGYVLARLAQMEKKRVSVINLFDPEKLKGEALVAYKDMLATGISPEKKWFPGFIREADVVVDAIFGTGLKGNVEGVPGDVVAAVNAAPVPVISIDIPSGLNADTGNIMRQAIDADVTTTFIGLKKGMFTADGPQCCGQIEFDRLNVPDECYQRLGEPSAWRLQTDELNAALTPRKRNSHKGSYGHVLIVGGDNGYQGAVRMAAEAAARVGAGLVSLATRATHAAQISAARPEIMSHGIAGPDQLVPLIERANVVAIGPGLGHSEWAKSLLMHVLETTLPLVIDADALTVQVRRPEASGQWVITPHPGEAARLLKLSARDIQADRFGAIKMLRERWPGPIILKGSGTLVADKVGRVFICDKGNPGMSSGGMGDVLTGVVAGLIAQGIEPEQAARLGVCLHADAADRAAHAEGERGLMAMDLMPHLRHLANPWPVQSADHPEK